MMISRLNIGKELAYQLSGSFVMGRRIISGARLARVDLAGLTVRSTMILGRNMVVVVVAVYLAAIANASSRSGT